MGKIKEIIIVVLVIISTLPNIVAQDTIRPGTDSANKARIYTLPLVEPKKSESLNPQAKKNGFLASPFIFFKPDTDLLFGGLGVYYFRLKTNDNFKQETRLSFVQTLFEYSLKDQMDIQLGANIFLPNESYIAKGFFRFKVFPDVFYGVGNDTPSENVEHYNHNIFIANTSLARKLSPGVFLGLEYRYANAYNIDFDEPTSEVLDNVTGINGGVNSGLGLIFTIDKRDNVINATKGYFLEFSKYVYAPKLGSSFSFSNVNFTFNKYFDLGKKQILATNTVANLNSGDPSFLFMAQAGGERILRSYPMNRFRDKNFIGTQVEYRRHLFWRFGMVGFAGLGDVFDTPDQFSWQRVKYSYGVGLRVMLNRQERLNFRLDYGIGRDSRSVYVTVTEAF